MINRGRYSRKTTKPATVQNKQTTPVQNNGGGFVGNVMTGMAFGVGSSIGHKTIDSMTSDKPTETTTQDVPCEKIFEMLAVCYDNEKNDCSHLQELLKKKC